MCGPAGLRAWGWRPRRLGLWQTGVLGNGKCIACSMRMLDWGLLQPWQCARCSLLPMLQEPSTHFCCTFTITTTGTWPLQGQLSPLGKPKASLQLVREVSLLDVGRPLLDLALVPPPAMQPQPPASAAGGSLPNLQQAGSGALPSAHKPASSSGSALLGPAPAGQGAAESAAGDGNGAGAPVPRQCVLLRWGGLLSALDLEKGSEVALSTDVEAFWLSDSLAAPRAAPQASSSMAGPGAALGLGPAAGSLPPGESLGLQGAGSSAGEVPTPGAGAAAAVAAALGNAAGGAPGAAAGSAGSGPDSPHHPGPRSGLGSSNYLGSVRDLPGQVAATTKVLPLGHLVGPPQDSAHPSPSSLGPGGQAAQANGGTAAEGPGGVLGTAAELQGGVEMPWWSYGPQGMQLWFPSSLSNPLTPKNSGLLGMGSGGGAGPGGASGLAQGQGQQQHQDMELEFDQEVGAWDTERVCMERFWDTHMSL